MEETNISRYRNKRVVKTVDDINEFIRKYPRTNKELNIYMTKKNKESGVSFVKSYFFYIITQITSILGICLIIFSIGFLIGNNVSSKLLLMNSINDNYFLINDLGARLIVNKNDRNILLLDIIINFNFDYSNIFMGTLISNVMLYYYPSNEIGNNADEVCYNKNNLKFKKKVLDNNILLNTISNYNKEYNKEKYITFLKEGSLVFFNYSIKDNKNNPMVTYINDILFNNLIAYPIGGSEITLSPGIMKGINFINVLASINHNIADTQLLDFLLKDCAKGRIYIQLHFWNVIIKTISFRFQPQMGTFLPFKIPCEIKQVNKIDDKTEGGILSQNNDDFRLSVLKNYQVQILSIKNINMFVN
ncbi:conserved protein, unknown function [Hepatocystis sp. ex Piliocolobus tephrosceles]|nr:conserved protein, unknown function [Hepatocystis sp. ex Piliocolobus tephrosceles]